jgi:hypothetical protein
MEKEIRKPSAETADDKALSEAIDRVYKKYGTDLRAFLRDVHDELALKRQESQRAKDEIR